MPRPEKPLSGSGPLAEFAAQLRALREQAGRPTYKRLEKVAGFSASTLSEAAGGAKFPTWDVTLAYVTACGGDAGRWRDRWETTRRVIEAEPAQQPDAHVEQPSRDTPQPQISPTPARRRRTGRRTFVVAATIVAVVIIGVTAAVVAAARDGASDRPRSPQSTAGGLVGTPMTRVADGADPKESGCSTEPAVATLDSHEVNVEGVPIGLLELRYSPRCGVAWGRFTPGALAPPITKPGPMEIHVDVYRPDDGVEHLYETVYIGLPVYGGVLHSSAHCVFASAHFFGKGWQVPASRTGCFRGTTGIRE